MLSLLSRSSHRSELVLISRLCEKPHNMVVQSTDLRDYLDLKSGSAFSICAISGRFFALLQVPQFILALQ